MNSLKDKKILIVEDDEILREVIVEEFTLCDCVVFSAISGNQALKKLKEESVPFDAIVTDVQMPDGDGAFLLDQIQKMNFTKRPVIIMVSGYSDLPTEELIKKGANIVLPKPFELNDLIDVATNLIKNS